MALTLGSAGSYLGDVALGLLLQGVDVSSGGLNVGVCIVDLLLDSPKNWRMILLASSKWVAELLKAASIWCSLDMLLLTPSTCN